MTRHRLPLERRLRVEPLEMRILLAADPILDPDFGDSGVTLVNHPGRDFLSGSPTQILI